MPVWSGNGWSSLNSASDYVVKEDLRKGTGELWDHEGKKYTVARFGSAGWWMTANLATENYICEGDMKCIIKKSCYICGNKLTKKVNAL